VAAGKPFWVGVTVTPDAGWHTYWINAGDAGFATSVAWTLPAGFTAGPLQWPYPKAEELGGIMSYGFGEAHTLLVEITPPGTLPPGPLKLAAEVRWLMCKETCIPGSASLDFELPPGAGAADAAGAAVVRAAREKLPVPVPADAPFRVEVSGLEGDPVIRLSPVSSTDAGVPEVHFFPDTKDQIDHAAPQRMISTRMMPPTHMLRLKRSADAPASLVLRGVLVLKFPTGTQAWLIDSSKQPAASPAAAPDAKPSAAAPPAAPAHEDGNIPWQPFSAAVLETAVASGRPVFVDFTADWCLNCKLNEKVALHVPSTVQLFRDKNVIALQGDWTHQNPEITAVLRAHGRAGVPMYLFYPAGSTNAVLLPEAITAGMVADVVNGTRIESGADRFFATALGKFIAAFLGGLILNIMPCVLPVLSLKIFSFVKQGGEDPRRIFRHGLVFAGGILLSFWALAGLLVGLEKLSGQLVGWGALQYQSPTFLAVMITVMFVMGLSMLGVFEIGASLTGAGQGLATRGGYAGSFFSGVLAVILATPCTAPFMGGAIAFALTEPAYITFGIFTVLALGLALPYLILSAKPAWLKFVPKPGAWMETFKQLMGFAMLGAMVWLFSIFASGREATALFRVCAFLLCIGIACWALGRFATPFSSGRAKVLTWLSVLGLAGAGYVLFLRGALG
jgi:thiol:disulfide interchange protein/DsbC/DsbD-like thiol-disulfide interchange protein